LEDDVKHWNDEDPDQRCSDHAAKDRGAHGAPAERASAFGNDQRQQAEDRSVIPSRCSIAASSNILVSEVIWPPSKATCTGLPLTDGNQAESPYLRPWRARTPCIRVETASPTE
jgi:hypothetical protein